MKNKNHIIFRRKVAGNLSVREVARLYRLDLAMLIGFIENQSLIRCRETIVAS